MDVLIDTNILIAREGDGPVPDSLSALERELNERGHRIVVHPESVSEILSYEGEDTRKREISRVNTYPQLDFSPRPTSDDDEFRSAISVADDPNEQVDNQLLYTVFNNDADFLITEDQEMHTKALQLGIEDRVFDIDGGYEYFLGDQPEIQGPSAINRTTLGELDLSDSFFDSLRDEYDNFDDWAESHPDRPAWVNYTSDGSVGALLVIKLDEQEQIGVDPELERRPRLKISTLKVGENRQGSKVGELFISIAVREAIYEGQELIYLTHYEQKNDYLVELLESYGFEHVSQREDGERIYQKRLIPPSDAKLSPVELSQKYYPTFYDGENVNKFVVPIQSDYHDKLFTTYENRVPTEEENQGEFRPEGNAIRKAYISNANTRQIESGDLLLFYRSHDDMCITSLGICEQVEYDVTDQDDISRIVGKRTVFSESELNQYADGGGTVILFSWHFDLDNPLDYQRLLEENVLSGPPQVMQRIDEASYQTILEHGGIDERFARD